MRDNKDFLTSLILKKLFDNRIAARIYAVIFGLGIWQAVAMAVLYLRKVQFPTPLESLQALWELLKGSHFLNATIYQHVLASGQRWLTGFCIAFVCAIAYAFLAYWNPRFRLISMPTVEVLQLVPGLAWVPVVILLFGLGNEFPLMLVVSKSFAEAHPEAVKALVEGTRKAIDFIKSDPDKAAAELSKITGVKPDMEKRTLQNLSWKVENNRTILDSLTQTADFLYKTGKLKKIPNIAEAMADMYLK